VDCICKVKTAILCFGSLGQGVCLFTCDVIISRSSLGLLTYDVIIVRGSLGLFTTSKLKVRFVVI
jgi:hypothetical protein